METKQTPRKQMAYKSSIRYTTLHDKVIEAAEKVGEQAAQNTASNSSDAAQGFQKLDNSKAVNTLRVLSYGYDHREQINTMNISDTQFREGVEGYAAYIGHSNDFHYVSTYDLSAKQVHDIMTTNINAEYGDIISGSVDRNFLNKMRNGDVTDTVGITVNINGKEHDLTVGEIRSMKMTRGETMSSFDNHVGAKDGGHFLSAWYAGGRMAEGGARRNFKTAQTLLNSGPLAQYHLKARNLTTARVEHFIKSHPELNEVEIKFLRAIPNIRGEHELVKRRKRARARMKRGIRGLMQNDADSDAQQGFKTSRRYFDIVRRTIRAGIAVGHAPVVVPYQIADTTARKLGYSNIMEWQKARAANGKGQTLNKIITKKNKLDARLDKLPSRRLHRAEQVAKTEVRQRLFGSATYEYKDVLKRNGKIIKRKTETRVGGTKLGNKLAHFAFKARNSTFGKIASAPMRLASSARHFIMTRVLPFIAALLAVFMCAICILQIVVTAVGAKQEQDKKEQAAATTVGEIGVYNALTQLGYSPEAACAILGNMYEESRFDPGAVYLGNSKSGNTRDNNDYLNTGVQFGLCQWSGNYSVNGTGDPTTTRWGRAITWCQSQDPQMDPRNTDDSNTVAAINAQVSWLNEELQEGYQSTYQSLMNAGSGQAAVEQATRDFYVNFEAGGKEVGQGKRTYAEVLADRTAHAIEAYTQCAGWTSDPASGDGDQQVIATARSYIQVIPYRPGAGGRSTVQGADCSGFVWLVLRQCGYAINYHVSTDYMNVGTPVNEDELQPGDLVIWDGPGHVGFYSGNGNVIEEASVKTGCVERPLSQINKYHSKLLGYRRIAKTDQ